MSERRLYLTVAAVAVIVYLGALWNHFAMDDPYIIAGNPLVRVPSGIWRAFAQPYWPAAYGGKMYRPLVIATFGVDRLIDGPAWFHLVNVCWHAGVTVVVAGLVRRWGGTTAALVAGLVFAVHPVHVEAVANVVGRAELLAALFTCLAVYAALARDSAGWCAVALACGVLSKENAAVAPALIAWGWLLGLAPRPPRRRLAAYLLSWGVVAVVYLSVRWAVLHPYARLEVIAPAFVGEGPLT